MVNNYFWLSPQVTAEKDPSAPRMYHSISETSHPLQTEEQEIGIDPLQSYVNKPEEGVFPISTLGILSSSESLGESLCYVFDFFL